MASKYIAVFLTAAKAMAVKDDESAKKRILRTVELAYRRGLITGAGGNVSNRAPRHNGMWITPRAVDKAGLRASDLVLVNFKGERLQGKRKPSLEWPFHGAIYRGRSDVNAVVHTHNPLTMGIVASSSRVEFLSIEAQLLLKEAPLLPYRPPGSADLAEAVAEGVKSANVLILEKHGVIGVGRSLEEARSRVEVLEEAALIQIVARLFYLSRHEKRGKTG